MKQVERYVYPAVLTFEEGYEIAVTFPDLPGCATSGKDEADAIAMGREAMALHLWSMEVDGDAIPTASSVKNIKLDDNEAVVFIEAYMPAVRLSQENRSVNRTVTLPAWLNAKALELGVNFSQVLQEALVNRYHIQR